MISWASSSRAAALWISSSYCTWRSSISKPCDNLAKYDSKPSTISASSLPEERRSKVYYWINVVCGSGDVPWTADVKSRFKFYVESLMSFGRPCAWMIRDVRMSLGKSVEAFIILVSFWVVAPFLYKESSLSSVPRISWAVPPSIWLFYANGFNSGGGITTCYFLSSMFCLWTYYKSSSKLFCWPSYLPRAITKSLFYLLLALTYSSMNDFSAYIVYTRVLSMSILLKFSSFILLNRSHSSWNHLSCLWSLTILSSFSRRISWSLALATKFASSLCVFFIWVSYEVRKSFSWCLTTWIS